MRCPKCGIENKDSAKFCYKCGFKMAAFSQPAYAPAPNLTTPPAAGPGLNEDLSTRPLSNASLLFMESGRQYEISAKPAACVGRADRHSGYSPDIDLTEDDRVKVVSRRHASILCCNSRYKICDLGSTNGTFLNGLKLQPGVEYDLKNGDEVIFGKIICIFSCMG